MKTLVLSADCKDTAAIAAEIIKENGLVAIPTETVYGLGANGLNEEAVAKIFIAKGRPQDNALTEELLKNGYAMPMIWRKLFGPVL